MKILPLLIISILFSFSASANADWISAQAANLNCDGHYEIRFSRLESPSDRFGFSCPDRAIIKFGDRDEVYYLKAMTQDKNKNLCLYTSFWDGRGAYVTCQEMSR
jgi:hypothetical protein